MIGLTRIYCQRGIKFRLVEVPTKDADCETKKLEGEGWEIEAEIPV